jgi:bifunctional UDP-N-acetylglucosamine pyrophosphorylase/glucosamine-1-phosphate N-acetyltransferase
VETPVTAVVLAAGAGTRMRSSLAKVLHEIGGRSLLGHALVAVRGARPHQVVVVVGQDRERVGRHALDCDSAVRTVVQDEQRGTGHAVQVALDSLDQVVGSVLVTYGDVPLLQPETLVALLADQARGGHAVSVLTAELADPGGYGRVLRDGTGAVQAIREHKDATAAELEVREVSSGTYAFDADFLVAALPRVGSGNAQGEVYLPDVVALAVDEGRTVNAVLCADVWQTEGVNDRVELARLGAELNRRTLEGWMRAGVTVVDPASTWVDVTVTLERDVTVRPGTQLHGLTAVGPGAIVGPDTTLTDTLVGAGASVVRTHGSGAELGPRTSVGPFAYLRPGTQVLEGGKVGTFVETKNARIGAGAKVPHLSYVGDADVGEGSNIGAGTIFANYDGVHKNRTVVGRHASTGCGNVFVAPVSIGDGAVTGAGTVVRRDVPPGALAVSAGAQRHLEDWVARKRPDSAAARAAAESDPPSDLDR